MRVWRCVQWLIGCVCLSLCGLGIVWAAQDVVLIQEGRGASLTEARQDAIRQALQKVVPQIVVSDRRIEGDEVVYDRLMSSLEGHVKGIEQLQARQDGAEVVARYKMVISTEEIENFVKLTVGSRAHVDGALMADAMTTELEARAFKGRYLTRLFRGYPGTAVEAGVASIRPGVQDPNVLHLVVRYQLSPAWLKAVMAGARNVACTADQREACAPKGLCVADSQVYLAAGVKRDCVALAPGPDKGAYPILFNMGLPHAGTTFLVYFEDERGQPQGERFCVVGPGRVVLGSYDRALVLVEGMQELKAEINVAAFREQLKSSSRIRVIPLSDLFPVQGPGSTIARERSRSGLTTNVVDPEPTEILSKQACTWVRGST